MTLRCLLVDDSPEFLASAARLLESQGLEIVGSATSGAEAYALAAEHNPDLALVDVELAEEDGLEVTQELGRRAPGTAVVLISAYDRDDLADLIANSRAAGFLPKNALGAGAIARLVPQP